MGGLSPNVSATLSTYLDAMQSMFIAGTRVTFLARPPLEPDKDGDVLVTNDDLREVIAAVQQRAGVADRARMDAFQAAIGQWMVEVFGVEIAMDRLERILRFLEEALELAQAEGMTADEVGRVVNYVYGRPAGETTQEVGGVMVTLAAFCFRRDVDLQASALTELDRIDNPEMRKRIFDKQAFKREQGLTSDGGFRKAGQ